MTGPYTQESLKEVREEWLDRLVRHAEEVLAEERLDEILTELNEVLRPQADAVIADALATKEARESRGEGLGAESREILGWLGESMQRLRRELEGT